MGLSLLLITGIAINSSNGDVKEYLRSRWNIFFRNPRRSENVSKLSRQPGIPGDGRNANAGQVETLWTTTNNTEATGRLFIKEAILICSQVNPGCGAPKT